MIPELKSDPKVSRDLARLPPSGPSTRDFVDLSCQHKNHTVLVEGPEITVRPVGTRRVTGGP